MGQKILLADDSNVAQRMGKEILGGEGFEVATVSNGQAALKKLKEYTPDLILADIFMPGATGYELCQFVKSDPQLAGIPVLLMVGAMEPYDPEEGRKVKSDGVITKPLQSSNLLTMVKKALASPRPAPPEPAPAPAKEPAVPVPQPAAEEPAPSAVAAEAAVEPEAEALPEPEPEMPREAAEQPLAPFEDLLAPSAPEPAPLEPEPLHASVDFAVASGGEAPAEADAAPEAAGGAFPVSMPSFDQGEETAQTPFAAQFPFEPAETAEPTGAEFGLASADASSETPAEREDSMSPLEFLTGSGQAPAHPEPDEGVLSIPSEVSLAEPESAAVLEPVVAESASAEAEVPVQEEPESVAVQGLTIAEPAAAEVPAQMVWTAEPMEVTEQDKNLFAETTADWGALAHLAEESAPIGVSAPAGRAESSEPIPAAIPEPSADAIPVGSAEPEAAQAQTPEPESPQTSLPAESPFDEPTPLAADLAMIERLVRESVERMMPQIVDRIVRNVGIVLKREQP